MDYILHKLILGNKDKTDLQFIVELLELSEKVFKTALSKKHKISHRLIYLITRIALLVAQIFDWPLYIFLSFAAPQQRLYDQ